MIKKNALILLLCLLSLRAFSGDGEYAVSKIPAALLVKAHMVKRMEQVRFDIVNSGEAVLYRKYALTILDESGDKYAAFFEYYDKLHTIKNIEGTLYDANGKELKKLKNKQVIDFSGIDDDLANDNRFKHHNFYYRVYPYTVQYEVEIKYNGTLFFPDWLPRERENFSVQQSSVSIAAPVNYLVRYKAINYPSPPLETTEKDRKVLTWEVKDQPAIEDEYASPSWYEINTTVFFAPADFSIERYQGSMNSWLEYGKFQYKLNEGRDQLPENVRQAVHRIADNITDPKQKVEKLYEYMQQNTRYISIQLGIGGWQPFDAKYVASKGYGDCKALSNYMFSLLKEAGIRSHYTLIYAGTNDNRIKADFPSAQFNHVVLSVPFSKDTMWLECTSQDLAAGYMGGFTGNRQALLITEDGGKMAATPTYGIKENTQVRNIRATLDEDATLHTNAKTRYKALQQDNIHSMINSLSKDKVKELLHEELDFPTYTINRFAYNENKTAMPVIEETLDIDVSNYATMTGKRLFITPNVMTRTHRKLQADDQRKFDIEIRVAYTDIDTVEILLPAGYTAESIPQETSLSTPFGNYASSVRLEGNRLFYYRHLEHNSGHFPARDYGALVKFYETIYKADRSKVVLVKSEAVPAPKGF